MARTAIPDDTALIDFTHRQGKTFRKGVRWATSGTVFDTTGWTARMELRSTTETDPTAEPALELTTENDRIILQVASGTPPEDLEDYTEADYNIILVIEASALSDMETGTYFYDLELVGPVDDPGPEEVIHCPIAGKFKLVLEYTR